MSEMVERVARMLADLADFAPDDDWHLFKNKATAVIEAMREPTDAMCRAADALDSVSKGVLITPIPAKAWEAMIDEALK